MYLRTVHELHLSGEAIMAAVHRTAQRAQAPVDKILAQTRTSSCNCSRLRGRVGLQNKFRAWLPLCERPDGP